MFFAGLIILNVCVMAAEAEYAGIEIGAAQGLQAGSPEAAFWPGAFTAFRVSHWVFGILFTAEVILKLIAFHCAYFKDPVNWLDCLIVSFWLLGVSGMGFGEKAQLGRLLRLVKLLRLLRIARAVQSLDSLFLMTTALKGSVMTLSWAVVLFVSTLSFFALLLTTVFGDFYFQDLNQPVESRGEVYMYFGTFSRALFTMFELTFANWPPVSRMLFEHVHICFMWLTVLYKLTLGFAVVGVINGVFMQETFKVASLDDNIMVRQKRRAQIAHKHKMRRLFHSADSDGDGRLSREEFKDVLEDEEVTQWLSAMEFPACHTEADINSLFEYLDRDGDEFIDMEELIKGVSRLQGSAKSIDVKILKHDIDEVLSLLRKASRSSSRTSTPLLGHGGWATPLESALKKKPSVASCNTSSEIPAKSVVISTDAEVPSSDQLKSPQDLRETRVPADDDICSETASSESPTESAAITEVDQVPALGPLGFPDELSHTRVLVDDEVCYSRV
jgi:Ca2+-binding EF-hand superfamily protein